MQDSNNRTGDLSKYSSLFAALIILASVLIRGYRYFNLDFWYDEALLIYEAHTFGLQQFSHLIFHPPLSNYLVALWLQISHNAVWLRLIPLLLTIGTMLVLYNLMVTLFTKKAGLWAMTVLAVMPLHVFYSRSIRIYCIQTFIIALAWLAFAKYENTHKPIWLALVTLSSTAALYTHYYALFSLFSLGLVVLFLSIFDRKILPVAAALIASVVLYIPWIFKLVEATGYIMNDTDFFPPPVSLHYMKRIIMILIGGYHSRSVTTCIAIGVLIVGSIILFFQISHRLKVILTGMLVVPLVIIYGVGVFLDYNYLIARYVTFLTVPVAVFAGAALSKWSFKVSVIPGVILISSLAAGVYFIYPDSMSGIELYQGVRPRKEFSEPAEIIADNWQEGDCIGHACLSSYPSFYYYLDMCKGISAGYVIDYNGLYSEWFNKVWRVGPYVDYYPWIRPRDYRTVTSGHKRLWFIASEFDIGVPGTFDTDFMWGLRAHLLDEYTLVKQWDFYGSPLYLFEL